jgi:hypothetical protein
MASLSSSLRSDQPRLSAGAVLGAGGLRMVVMYFVSLQIEALHICRQREDREITVYLRPPASARSSRSL